MPILRSVLGIGAGAAVIFVLVGTLDVVGGVIFNGLPDPETGQVSGNANTVGMSVWNLAWYLPIACLGGWLCALIAGRKPMLHAGIIAALIVVGGIVFVFLAPTIYENYGVELPGWYAPLLPVSGAVGALLGGRLKSGGRPAPSTA